MNEVEIIDYVFNLNKAVTKISRKPFKSGEKVNTVNSIALHPITGRLVYTFNEDDSIVECKQCKRVV